MAFENWNRFFTGAVRKETRTDTTTASTRKE